MPIRFNKQKGWYIDKPTQEETEAIKEIGKNMIVEGLAGSYTNERYQAWLLNHPIEKCFKA